MQVLEKMKEERIIPLNGCWTLAFHHPGTGDFYQIPATVPGNFALDLVRAGLLKESEVMPPDTTAPLREWEKVDQWIYQTWFDAPETRPDESIELCFHGIDTVAEIRLNGESLGRCENMFISHYFTLSENLNPHDNRLEVIVFDPIRHSETMEHDAVTLWTSCDYGPSYIRKTRCLWGWDNAPRIVTGGLWRPVELLVKSSCRFDEIYLYTRAVAKDSASVGVSLKIAFPESLRYRLTGRITFSRQGETVLIHEFPVDQHYFTFNDLQIKNPHLWWPRGYGEANLYEVTLELLDGTKVIASKEQRLGIRTVKLVWSEVMTEEGEGEFLFICNRVKIYCRGANWKPADAFFCNVTPERTRRGLQLALDANCNMIRIWGGGYYEDHDFYDFCDANGLMVWQDFMMACEYPPQSEEFRKLMADEANFVIRKLRNHPSLVLWCGDNEVDKGFYRLVQMPRGLLPSDNRITREVLRNEVLRFDPFRCYLPSSPYISDEIVRDRRKDWRKYAPQLHLYVSHAEYRASIRRFPAPFLGETGPSIYCAVSDTPEFIVREMPRLRRLWDSRPEGVTPPGWGHQTDHYCATWQKTAAQVIEMEFNRTFPMEEFDDFALALNFICAGIYKYAVEYYRMNKWNRTGVLWWSLFDMWPMMFNYSVADYALRPKLPFFWIRQSQQPVCLMMNRDDDNTYTLALANDTLHSFDVPYRVLRYEANENRTDVVAESSAMAPANSSVRIAVGPNSDIHGLMLLEWTIDGDVQRNHFIAGEPPYDFAEFKKWHAYLRQYLKI